jgi:molybdopterin molybdotransferase
LHKNERILEAGIPLRAQEIGFLAMFGQSQVIVHRKPRIGLISTGDELLAPGQELRPGMIYESNSPTLASLVEEAGGEVVYKAIAQDSEQVVRYHLDQCYGLGVNLILSSAGVSVGAFDFVRTAVENDGELLFWRVNLRPGKPLAFGRYRGIPFAGLPGNPVSAFVGFKVFIHPAISKMSGRKHWSQIRLSAVLKDKINSDGRESYLRAVIKRENGELAAYLTGQQDSGNLRSLVQANAFIIVPSEVKSLPIGTKVDAWLIGDSLD